MALTQVQPGMLTGNNPAIPTSVGVGTQALNSNSGANNTAVGYQAGYANTTATENSFLGYQAGYSHTAGGQATFIGNQAGFSNTGYGNTALGHHALRSGTTGTLNGAFGRRALFSLTTGANNTAVGCNESGSAITTGSSNTILGTYNGNQNDLDLRTASNNIVLSDGDGNARIYNSNNGVTRLFTAAQNTLTNNSKGGTVTILPRSVFFPASYFDAIDSCTIYINCVASEGTAGGYTRTDILHVNYRFGYAIASLGSNANDGVSVSTWTYSFDANGLRVTQNWGASGSNLGCRWSFFITGCLFLG
jgi:hypothetical protein